MMGGIGAALIVVSAVSPILVLPRLFDLYSARAKIAISGSTIEISTSRAIYTLNKGGIDISEHYSSEQKDNIKAKVCVYGKIKDI